jgi:hypothetical protein
MAALAENRSFVERDLSDGTGSLADHRSTHPPPSATAVLPMAFPPNQTKYASATLGKGGVSRPRKSKWIPDRARCCARVRDDATLRRVGSAVAALDERRGGTAAQLERS